MAKDKQKQKEDKEKIVEEKGWNTNDHFMEGLALGALIMFVYMKWFQGR